MITCTWLSDLQDQERSQATVKHEVVFLGTVSNFKIQGYGIFFMGGHAYSYFLGCLIRVSSTYQNSTGHEKSVVQGKKIHFLINYYYSTGIS